MWYIKKFKFTRYHMIILPGLAKIILLKNDPILLLFHPGLRVYIINFEIVEKKKWNWRKSKRWSKVLQKLKCNILYSYHFWKTFFIKLCVIFHHLFFEFCLYHLSAPLSILTHLFPMHPFLTPEKGVGKGCIGKNWVKWNGNS